MPRAWRRIRHKKAICDSLTFAPLLDRKAADQREALILVGASGLSYEEAATMCGCAVGTMKSRVNRARTKLAEMLSEPPDNFVQSDSEWDAAVGASWAGARGPGADR